MSQSLRQKSLRLLMVEDSVDDADLVVREFHRAGYEIEYQRVDTREGLLAAIDGQLWDVIICDYSMPHFSGADALHLVRERDLDTPLIYLSGTVGEETAIQALKRGAQDYLMKGNLRRLLPAIERELREVEQRREKARLQQQIQQLEKFEAVGRLAGGIAHDFTNVLSAIFGWAQLGEEEALPGSRLRERFQKIETEAKRAADITQKLLAFGRCQVLQPIALNLNKLTSDTKQLLAAGLGSSIELKLILAPDLHGIQADPAQISQVIMNLSLNAKDAMPEGGTLTIETRNVLVDENFRATHSGASHRTYVQLSVSDNGTGMDSLTREKIFEPFFTTKPIGAGTGLGLSTVYGIVKQHDGFIDVETKLGEGTTFRIYFPSLPGVLENPPRFGMEVALRGTETILLVDDDDSLREVSREILVSLGYTVLTAENGNDAIHVLRKQREEIQLVLLDVIMPAMGGLEAYAAIKEIKPSVRVILTTGHAAQAFTTDAMPRNVPFLRKPYSPRTLSQIIRSTLDSKPPHDFS